MQKITDISAQKKNPSRVNVYLNEEFAFGISTETRVTQKLKVGQLLSENKLKNIVEIDQVERLVMKAFRFLSYRPRSEKEIRDYLLWKGKLKDLDKSDAEKSQYEKSVEKTLQKLKKINQINDQEFANWLVEQRKKFRPRGSRLIKIELLQKGIDRDLIDQILDGVVTDDEFDLALKSAQKKALRYKNLSNKEFKIKMGQYIARRGFDWNIVKKTVDTLIKKRVQ